MNYTHSLAVVVLRAGEMVELEKSSTCLFVLSATIDSLINSTAASLYFPLGDEEMGLGIKKYCSYYCQFNTDWGRVKRHFGRSD